MREEFDSHPRHTPAFPTTRDTCRGTNLPLAPVENILEVFKVGSVGTAMDFGCESSNSHNPSRVSNRAPNNPEQLVPIQAELSQTEMPKRINLREAGLRRSARQAEIRTQRNDLSKQVITLFALLSHQCESSMSRLPISPNATPLQCHQTG